MTQETAGKTGDSGDRSASTSRRQGAARRRTTLSQRLRNAVWWLLWRLSETRLIEGVEVRVFESSPESQSTFARATAALQLIARSDRMRIHKLRTGTRGLLFTHAGGGSYLPSLNICRFGIEYSARRTPLQLAMTIVHESTHARLARLGCGYEAEIREEVERTCVGAEITFAEKIPGSQEEIERARALLAREWWKEEALTIQAKTDLERLGVPPWLAKLLSRRR